MQRRMEVAQETLDAARSQFDPDDIDYSTDDGSASDDSDSEDGSDSSSGGELSEDEGSTRKRQKKKRRSRSRAGRRRGSCSEATSENGRCRRLDIGDKREIKELVETVIQGNKREMAALIDSMRQLAVSTGIDLSRPPV